MARKIVTRFKDPHDVLDAVNKHFGVKLKIIEDSMKFKTATAEQWVIIGLPIKGKPLSAENALLSFTFVDNGKGYKFSTSQGPSNNAFKELCSIGIEPQDEAR